MVPRAMTWAAIAVQVGSSWGWLGSWRPSIVLSAYTVIRYLCGAPWGHGGSYAACPVLLRATLAPGGSRAGACPTWM